MKFGKFGDRRETRQAFDKEKITLTKAGQTYNVYDAIQAANVDTDIVEVMKKYHCQQDEALAFMEKKGGMKGIYADFAQMQEEATTFPEIFALKKHADQTFANLPSEIREKYGNNLEKFFEDLNEKANEINKKSTEQDKKSEVETNAN